MSNLKNLAAQILLLGFEGAATSEVVDQVTPLIELGVAGFILFSNHFNQRQLQKNIVDYDQTKLLIESLHITNHHYHELPVLVAVDYEGGSVDRLAHLKGSPITPSAQQSALWSKSQFDEMAQAMANFCHQLGFNVNFAPVVDLNLTDRKGIINQFERSYGSNPIQVSHLAWQFMQPFLKLGIACCLKHYPGHGSAIGDTHQHFVDVSDTYNHEELLPFQNILQNKHPLVTVMTAHVVNRQLDSTGLPATLSKAMLNEYLRIDWQYNGIIVSDDLQMLALARHYSLRQRLAMAINAGCDLLIIGNQMDYDNPMEVIDTLVSLVNNGDVSESRLKQAAGRVNKFKQHINNKEAV